MVQSSEFTRVGVDEAGQSLSVILRKQGIHRGARITAQVMSALTTEEIEKLQEQGHIEEDSPITHHGPVSDIDIGRGDKIGPRQIDTALAIAETLAALRELDCARVNVMGIYMGGNYDDYVKSTILLVRRQA